MAIELKVIQIALNAEGDWHCVLSWWQSKLRLIHKRAIRPRWGWSRIDGGNRRLKLTACLRLVYSIVGRSRITSFGYKCCAVDTPLFLLQRAFSTLSISATIWTKWYLIRMIFIPCDVWWLRRYDLTQTVHRIASSSHRRPNNCVNDFRIAAINIWLTSAELRRLIHEMSSGLHIHLFFSSQIKSDSDRSWISSSKQIKQHENEEVAFIFLEFHNSQSNFWLTSGELTRLCSRESTKYYRET